MLGRDQIIRYGKAGFIIGKSNKIEWRKAEWEENM